MSNDPKPKRAWNVTVSAFLNCSACGHSTIDHAARSASEAIAYGRADGWRLVDGKTLCESCQSHPEAPPSTKKNGRP